MPAPLQLDTSREDWRRQFRGITTCKGPTCGARIGWAIHVDEQGREHRIPYNVSDGRIHHSTCPDVDFFKKNRSSNRPADAPPAPPPPPPPPPPPKPAPAQASLFGGHQKPDQYPD